MEITSFVLGMLTIVATFISMSIVAGLTKINKLTRKTESLTQLCAAIEGDLRREIENMYNNMNREDEEIRRVIEDKNREVWRQFEDCGRDVTMVEKTLMNQVDETRRYIDSRIDKVVLKGTEQGSKQILKG